MRDSWQHAVCQWAKLQLPNGQKVRSVWFESSVTTSVQHGSCVEVSDSLDPFAISMFRFMADQACG